MARLLKAIVCGCLSKKNSGESGSLSADKSRSKVVTPGREMRFQNSKISCAENPTKLSVT